MGKIRSSPQISNLKTIEDVVRFIQPFITDVSETINGNIQFDQNCSVAILDVTFDTANAEKAVSHSLGRVPIGYFKIGSGAATVLYNGTTANDSSTIYLQANVATTAKVLVF